MAVHRVCAYMLYAKHLILCVHFCFLRCCPLAAVGRVFAVCLCCVLHSCRRRGCPLVVVAMQQPSMTAGDIRHFNGESMHARWHWLLIQDNGTVVVVWHRPAVVLCPVWHHWKRLDLGEDSGLSAVNLEKYIETGTEASCKLCCSEWVKMLGLFAQLCTSMIEVWMD